MEGSSSIFKCQRVAGGDLKRWGMGDFKRWRLDKDWGNKYEDGQALLELGFWGRDQLRSTALRCGYVGSITSPGPGYVGAHHLTQYWIRGIPSPHPALHTWDPSPTGGNKDTHAGSQGLKALVKQVFTHNSCLAPKPQVSDLKETAYPHPSIPTHTPARQWC